MRKHLSVFMLIVRSCIYKVLLIFLAMAAADVAIFALFPQSHYRLFADIISQNFFALVFAAAFVLVTLSLLSVCTAFRGQPRYILARLSISEKAVMGWHWLCGALCYLALWFWQIMLLYALARWHHASGWEGVVSHQSIFLDAFRSDFIHSVLPLEDISRIARNLVMAICTAGMVAAAAYRMRRGKRAGFGPAFAAALAIGVFSADYFEVSYDAFVMTIFAVLAGGSIGGLFTGDPEVDYEEASLEN